MRSCRRVEQVERKDITELKHEGDNEEYQQRAALYSLGALSQLEARAFEKHLREGCQDCKEGAAQFEKVVEVIGFGVSPVTPPAYIRDVLQARIEKEHQAQEMSPSPQIVAEQKPERGAGGPSSPLIYLPWAIAASLAVFSLISAFAWWQAGRENKKLQEQMASSRRKTEEMAQINAALSVPGARIIELSGQQPAPSSNAKIYWDVKSNRWIVTADLPPPPAGKIYQLWFITPAEKKSAGLIKPDASGHGFATIEVPSDLGPLDAAAITLEPEGGSAQPTMPIYAYGATG